MPAITPRTITTPVAMDRHLAEIRRLGYAVDDEERTEGVRCVAAPVFSHDGEIVAAISLAAPTIRCSPERLAALGAEIAATALAISRRLGFSDRDRTRSEGGVAVPAHAPRHEDGHSGRMTARPTARRSKWTAGTHDET